MIRSPLWFWRDRRHDRGGIVEAVRRDRCRRAARTGGGAHRQRTTAPRAGGDTGAAARTGCAARGPAGARRGADRADGALEAIALADGHTRWRTDLAVDALVRSGGHLYAVGPAPDPVPFLAVYAVSAGGAAAGRATLVPALAGARPDVTVTSALPGAEADVPARRGARPQFGQAGPALLISTAAGDDLRLEWHGIVVSAQQPAGPPGPLGGAAPEDWPDACAVIGGADPSRGADSAQGADSARGADSSRGAGGRGADSSRAAGLSHSRCVFVAAGGPSFTVETLWSGSDAAQRWGAMSDAFATAGARPVDVDGADAAVRSQPDGTVRIVMRVGRVIVAVTATGPAKDTARDAATRAAARVAANLSSSRRR